MNLILAACLTILAVLITVVASLTRLAWLVFETVTDAPCCAGLAVNDAAGSLWVQVRK